MENGDNSDADLSFLLPYASSSDLKGRQSVRATFKLTEKTIDAVSIVATHLGIKQKSLFDHLIEDIQSLSSIAHEVCRNDIKRERRVQKTYVMSRKSLSYLDRISKDYNAPRDILVEFSVQRLLPIIRREREKHKKRKALVSEFEQYLQAGKKLLTKTKDLLGEDDPVYADFKTAVSVCENAHRKIESFVEKGNMIEDF